MFYPCIEKSTLYPLLSNIQAHIGTLHQFNRHDRNANGSPPEIIRSISRILMIKQ